MTFDELLRAESNAPVRCADGKFGLLVRWYEREQAAGVQVFGEPDIREIPCSRLRDVGNGAIEEAHDRGNT